jgi:tRNA nucleotidyltransferase/poly(A) polymerase
LQPEVAEAWLIKYPLLRKVVQILQAHHLEAYVVGGAVRDLLLERENIVDLDFAVPGDGLAVARRVANALGGAYYPLDAERGTGRVVLDTGAAPPKAKTYLDFATLRGSTLLEDLVDRDFTINAIALSTSKALELIDPLQGRRDLAARQIRATSTTTFKHDPVRVVRAVRQAVELDFVIEAETDQTLREAASELPGVSPERRRDELLKLLNTPAPGRAVQMLRRLGVLPYLLPEIMPMMGVSQGSPHYLDVFDHTTAALDAWAGRVTSGFSDLPASLRPQVEQQLNEPLAGNLTQQNVMPLALLLHDTGKPSTRSQDAGLETRVRFVGHEQASVEVVRPMMQHFRFSSQATDFVETVVAQHMRPLLLAGEDQVSRRAIYRFFRDTSAGAFQAGVAVALHALADHQATYPPGQGQAEGQRLLAVVTQLVTAYFEQRDQVVEPPPLLTGRDLMEQLGLAEGRLIGVLLGRLREAQATGEVADKAGAIAFIEADPDFIKQNLEQS